MCNKIEDYHSSDRLHRAVGVVSACAGMGDTGADNRVAKNFAAERQAGQVMILERSQGKPD